MVPLVALHRMHQPSSPVPHPPTPFCPNDLSTSSLSLSLSSSFLSPSSASSLALPRPGFNAVLQFQPHFCASLSPRANSDNMSRPYQTAVLIGVRIFFQAIQSFSQESARSIAPLYDHVQRCENCRNTFRWDALHLHFFYSLPTSLFLSLFSFSFASSMIFFGVIPLCIACRFIQGRIKLHQPIKRYLEILAFKNQI